MSLAKALGVPVRRRPPITTRYDHVAPQVNIRGIPTFTDGGRRRPIIGGGVARHPLLPIYKSKPARFS